MSFFTLPPEINSLRMFLGAGSGPMLAAAAAWEGLADELAAAAQSFQSVTAGLAGQAWQGPAAQAMAAAAAPYAGWLAAAATQSAGASAQARAVASMFEAAKAATVLPQAVAANRDAFVQLVMSNLFGQNAPAIAFAESLYEEMWAADVAAMSGYYSGVSSVAAQVVPWSSVLKGLPGLGGANGAGAETGGGALAAGAAGTGVAGAGGGGGGEQAVASGGGGVAAGGGGPVAGGAQDLLGANTGAGFTQGDPSAGAVSAGGYTAAASGGMTAANPGMMMSPAMMAGPMMMAGMAANSGGQSGLINAGPVKGPKSKEEEEAEAKRAAEAAAAEEAALEAEAAEEGVEVAPEVPAMSVLATADPEAAAKAAPGAATTQATRTRVSGIPEAGLRVGAKAKDEESSETGEKVPTLRPEPKEFRPQVEEEEEQQLQIRGG